MPNAESLIKRKSAALISIHPASTVIDAVDLMNSHRIGSIVVVEGERLVGIFTERDLLRRVAARRLDPSVTPVESVMTSAVVVARPDTSLNEIAYVMREQDIRHMPVVDDQHRVVGIVSIGDLNKAEIGQEHRTVRYFETYSTK
ncbi:MAG: CBS domain-containing protein [Phycisphaerales bacterium]|nr:CBS domain-containing protein [Phycisphaerales bacterium]